MDKRIIDYSNNNMILNDKSLFSTMPKITLDELKEIKKFLFEEDCNYTTEFDRKDDILVINMSNYTSELVDDKIVLKSLNNRGVLPDYIDVKELVLDFDNDSSTDYFIKYTTAKIILSKVSSKRKKLTIWNEEIIGWSYTQKRFDMQSFQMVLGRYPILKILEFVCCNSIEVTGGIFFLEELIFINCSYVHIDDSDFEFRYLKTIILINCNTIILKLQKKKLTTLKIYSSGDIKFKDQDILIENLIIDDNVNKDKLPYALSTQIVNNPLAKR